MPDTPDLTLQLVFTLEIHGDPHTPIYAFKVLISIVGREGHHFVLRSYFYTTDRNSDAISSAVSPLSSTKSSSFVSMEVNG